MGSLLLIVPAFILLHEGGHALVAALCGAKIAKISILDEILEKETEKRTKKHSGALPKEKFISIYQHER